MFLKTAKGSKTDSRITVKLILWQWKEQETRAENGSCMRMLISQQKYSVKNFLQ